MRRGTALLAGAAALLVSGALRWNTGGAAVTAQETAPDVQIDQASIGGVVVNSGDQRPEAGVWVVAQTSTLPTPFRRIVVTDDQGRFVVPDLPAGSYVLWVRGYGLKDSARVNAARGARVRLQVASAKDPREAAQIYPSGYWFSLLEPPSKEALLRKGFSGRDHWAAQIKESCGGHCHDVGGLGTRVVTGAAQWEVLFNRHRGMRGEAGGLGIELLTDRLADWTSRTWAGEVPPSPPRPVGVERNVVLTQWNWALAESFIHDVTSTDKRNPALYPYGPVYGLDSAEDSIWALDPVKHTVTRYDVEPRASRSEGYNPKLNYYHDGGLGAGGIPQWGTHPHNPMLDDKGRIWVTAQVRGERPQDYPDWMRKTIVTETNAPAEIDAAEKLLRGSSHHRQLAYFDTKQKRFVPVDTVFGTHHLQFDRQGRIWTNTSSAADGVAVGMFDPSKFDADNPENTEPEAQKAYVRVDPRTGAHIPGWGYAVIPNPVDGTIWQANSQTDGPNNKLFVLDPKTGKFKDYPLPLPGRGPHGIDATTDGKLWFPTASGHLGRFDPKTELFTYWDLPGPKFKNVGSDTGSAQWAYFLWVDQFDALGLGKDTVIVCGTSFSALQAFNPRTESFTVITIPYPLTFYMRGLDGRIDDPKAGWKGRGLWTAYNGYLPRLFTESRIGTLVHVQLRPNPLAY